jgi:hypothetical protein
MLTKAEVLTFIQIIDILHECSPLIHQLLPQPLGLLKTDGEITHIGHDLMAQLRRQLIKFPFQPLHSFSPPFPLLRRHVSRADNSLKRINQKQRENLAMTRFCRISEGERLNLMLQHIRECQQTSFIRSHFADLLDSWAVTLDIEEVAYAIVIILTIIALGNPICGHFCAECEVRVCDVCVVVVV